MPLIDSTDAELDAFDQVCERLGGFSDRISAEWVDGYLTALAAGPRAVAVDEWLPLMAEDAFERAFADPDDVARAHQALAARCRVLASHLNPEELLDQPEALRLQPRVNLWDDEARQQLKASPEVTDAELAMLNIGAIWAHGFLDAVHDFDADWQPLLQAEGEDREVVEELLSHLDALQLADDHDDFKAHLARHWAGREPTREDLLDEACFAVQDLRVWWLDHAPKPATRRVEATPGRNDPCPCGSGLKFKKCHGKSA